MEDLKQIFLPEHQIILNDKEKYSTQDIFDAQQKAVRERNEAEYLNITIDELRFRKQIVRKETNNALLENELKLEKLQNADIKDFGNKCLSFITQACELKGAEFNSEEGKTLEMYREIIRYFHWYEPCTVLDKKRSLFLFGVYGCGKSLCVKSILKAILYHRKNDWEYFHLPTITKNYMAQSGGKYKPDAFDELFRCTKNMIIDEIGDRSEKQKFYGNEIESVRSLILDKYDKWISSEKPQKIVFTSNLFPDSEYFFNQIENDNRPTLRNFYDEKVYNKMGEMCNFVRFPNVSYRVNNKIELL